MMFDGAMDNERFVAFLEHAVNRGLIVGFEPYKDRRAVVELDGGDKIRFGPLLGTSERQLERALVAAAGGWRG